eukprot:gnl/TRDRNA2_/TRDRNA2_162540_c1_seq1.p1 gnl/TRDRNA2_/TRDRNA2_162540_c1~~gnl/TRDRNA2_/TRDRNA2_162540_c1_seq1.p1  ORF type:complete len:214 (-),score=29.51 gnl/TRDRNA2_/TRDRNA2_162540_c1_seq1:66-707(-)
MSLAHGQYPVKAAEAPSAELFGRSTSRRRASESCQSQRSSQGISNRVQVSQSDSTEACDADKQSTMALEALVAWCEFQELVHFGINARQNRTRWDPQRAEGVDAVKEATVVTNACLPAPAAMQWEKADALVLGLRTEDGRIVQACFRKRPLGIDFDREAPIVITRVKTMSLAEEAGVIVGTTVVSINGEDVRDKSFKEQFDLMGATAVRLPLA